MKYVIAFILVAAPAIATAADHPHAPGTSPLDPIVVEKCSIEYERSTVLGAFVLIQAGGRIQESYVRPGTQVKAGQVLGRLHDRDARAEWARLTHAIDHNVDIPLAAAKLAQNRATIKRSRNLFLKQMYSKAKLEEEELEERVLQLELEDAKHQRRQDELTRTRVEAEISSREMVAPHDGVVVEVLKRVGESTAVNESVYRIVDLDLLRVSGLIDVRDAWRVRKGQPVRVSVDLISADLPIEREVFTGHVTFVDPQIDPEMRTCRVVAEVSNRDELLRSGLEARMEIVVDPGATPGSRPVVETKSASAATGVSKR